MLVRVVIFRAVCDVDAEGVVGKLGTGTYTTDPGRDDVVEGEESGLHAGPPPTRAVREAHRGIAPMNQDPAQPKDVLHRFRVIAAEPPGFRRRLREVLR